MQDHGRGLQPVAFLSKVMTKEQQGYPTHEQELLALMIALEEWRHYVLPPSFTVRTDHNGLRYLRTQSSLNDRQWRWLARLSEYRYDLEYRAGKNMQVPDGLSRKPHPEGEQPSLKVKDLEQENTHMVIRVTTKDGTKHKVLLNLKTQKEAHQEEIPKVFDYGELYQTLEQLGDGQLKPSESR